MDASFLSFWRIHTRVVRALILREIRTRFGRSKLGYLWALLEPIIHIGTLVVIFRFGGRTQLGGQPLELFFMTGIVIWLLFFNTLINTTVAVSANKSLLSYPQVSTYDIMVARILLEAATSLAVYLILSVVFAMMGLKVDIQEPLLIVSAFVMASLMGAGIGMLICAGKFWLHSLDKVIMPAIRILYFASGVFFSVGHLPEKARHYIMFNPFVHIIETGREGFFRHYSTPSVDFRYAAMFTIVVFLLGLISDRLIQSKVAAG